MAFHKRIAAETVKVMDEGWAKIAHLFTTAGTDTLAEMDLRRLARFAGVKTGSIRQYCDIKNGQVSLKPWGKQS